jgi:UDP-N-acetylmuramate--alanine ligase
MIDFENIENVYFLGIGGIGMSALARFANHAGKCVAGYDLTRTPLTDQLISESITIDYTEDINQLPAHFSCTNTLVVRTPAVPETHSGYQFFKSNGYQMVKRSELLGFLTNNRMCIAVSGTHGKTSVSTMTTLLIKESGIDVGAFLGGISRNFDSNLLLPSSAHSMVVTEADEYDRSFLRLNPSMAVITSVDADHLDIYGDHASVIEAFEEFAAKITDRGVLLRKKGIEVGEKQKGRIRVFSYSANEEADFYARRIRISNGAYLFDLVLPGMVITDIKLSYPGRVNVENMVAAASLAILAGADPMLVKKAVDQYKGVQRRFDIRFKNEKYTYIDDYAHHPTEIWATVSSVKELYAGKKVLGIFQPHLYTRTRDFAEGFGRSLDLLDEVILLDIYPARELPIPGITAETIIQKMVNPNKAICRMDDLLAIIDKKEFDILITMGAGNIDKMAEPLVELLKGRAQQV